MKQKILGLILIALVISIGAYLWTSQARARASVTAESGKSALVWGLFSGKKETRSKTTPTDSGQSSLVDTTGVESKCGAIGACNRTAAAPAGSKSGCKFAVFDVVPGSAESKAGTIATKHEDLVAAAERGLNVRGYFDLKTLDKDASLTEDKLNLHIHTWSLDARGNLIHESVKNVFLGSTAEPHLKDWNKTLACNKLREFENGGAAVPKNPESPKAKLPPANRQAR